MFDWMGDAWDTFTGLFGGSAPASIASDSYAGTLNNLDIDGSGSIGSMPIADYKMGGNYDYLSDYGVPDGGSDFLPSATNPAAPATERSIYDSLTSAPVLGAVITSGAGLFGGMSQLDAQKQGLKARQEEVKMNQMLELAKLKYQLLGKGAAGGGGGRRSGGSSQDQDAQFSARQSSGYQALGANLANIYR